MSLSTIIVMLMLVAGIISSSVPNDTSTYIDQTESFNNSTPNTMDKPRRSLKFTADGSMSIISGSGIDDFNANETQTIVVEPRDSSNTSWGPGYPIYIQISNRCTYVSMNQS